MVFYEKSSINQAQILASKWFPGRNPDLPCLAEAVFLEKDYWEKFTVSVANGIAKAFNGK